MSKSLQECTSRDREVEDIGERKVETWKRMGITVPAPRPQHSTFSSEVVGKDEWMEVS